MSFSPDDLDLIRKNGTTVPNFWPGLQVPPAQGDLVRFGGRQYVVTARVWEYTERGPLLRLYMGDGSAQSDVPYQ
ncbi:MAG: hypothetical protein E6Q78_05195 [Rhodoferax sp.]|nr:MAG: hypothetical protein E6Q78_05195 [Rhodoferax sp.]